jgi:mxaJ protein
MLEQLKRLGVIVFVASLSLSAVAESEIKDSEIPTLNPDEGRVGEIRRVTDDTEFKVCADPDNMPYSNVRQEGFEDKIAAVLAEDLGKTLSFAYAYNRQGFLRNTINAMRCDVIIGTAKGYDALTTSVPYYRSGYVFLWRKDSNYNIKDWDSPDLKKGIIGIVDKSPATVPLNEHDLMANARPYRLQRDLNLPPSFLVDDLEKGDIDVAVVWGPIAGYYAKQSKVPLEMAFIPEYKAVNPRGKEFWNIAVGVRKHDKDRIEMINGALERSKDKIAKIMAEYGIPTVPVVDERRGGK